MNHSYSYNDKCLAVIGMACRFPGARNLEQFWDNLCAGAQAMRFVPLEELRRGAHGPVCEREDYIPVFSGLDDISLFDAEHFGYSPSEAEIMDPQHRLLLETVWEALENACDVTGDNNMRRTGVYTSCNLSAYMLNNLYGRALAGELDLLEAAVGNNLDFLPTRIAYKLDFRGQALAIQSACSSSLASLHIATQALLAGECDRAVVGSASVTVPTRLGYFYTPGGIRSPDGRCRPFDAEAQGAVFGSGVGAVVLKRLQDALADRDPVWAVIRGSAANNDGSLKMGFTAPSQNAQAEVIAEAIRMAEVSPLDISFIEGHGTATPLGDPIEVAALLQAYAMAGAVKPLFGNDSVALGSVKGNIGHLDCTAGMAGFIKAVLSLSRGVFPGTANFTKLNPRFGKSIAPFSVTASNTRLAESPRQRLAGVSSFGFGGTNVHIVLQGADNPRTTEQARRDDAGPCLFLLSAPSEELLSTLQKEIGDSVEKGDSDPGDVAYSLATGRRHGAVRRVLTANGAEGARAAFSAPPPPARTPRRRNREVAFFFPGQGAQFPNMFRNEYAGDARFRAIFEENARMVTEADGPDAVTLLSECWTGNSEAAASLNQTRIIQPVLFALELSLAARLMEMGVTPAYLIGHSLGEYVAACLAGVFSARDCSRLIVARGEIMQKAPAAKMLAALLPTEKLDTALGALSARVEFAVFNSRENRVLSGPEDVLEQCRAALHAAGGAGIYLQTSHAFHTSSMDCVLEEFHKVVAAISLAPPRLPLVSNVTGTWAGPEMATANYWTKHLRSSVLFDQGLRTLFSRPVIGLELGPGQVLSSLARQELGGNAATIAPFTGLSDSGISSETGLTRALAELWLSGVDVDWQAHYAGKNRHRLHLPNTPLLSKRYWIDSALAPSATRSGTSDVRRDRGGVPGGPAEGGMPEHAPGAMHPRPESLEYLPAETALESALVALWEDALRIAPIGVDDPFIELGGNSLHVLRMIRMAHEKGITLSIKDVFDGGTISGLCDILSRRGDSCVTQKEDSIAQAQESAHVDEQDMQTLLAMLQK